MLQGLKEFLAEAADDDGKLKHLEHAEDLHLNNGAAGFVHATKTLRAVHNAIKGQPSEAHITTKFDGSPSLVFGHNPDNGKFFVASKSAFNKNPKINYTEADIEQNHGHAPGLVDKLKHALKHMPKVTPDKGVYQGDVMYSGKDVSKDKDNYHFKPNTMTYSVPKGTTEGRKVEKAKFGIVVHTQYKGKDLGSMTAGFKPDTKGFKDHPDVHIISHGVDAQRATFHPSDEKKYQSHMDAAEAIHNDLQKSGGYNAIQQHTEPLKRYINATVRNDTKPSVEGYVSHVTERGQKETDKLKSEKGKTARQAALKNTVSIINQHKQHLDRALEMHHHLQQAKDHLVNALSTAGGMKTSIRGKDTKGEGYVATVNGQPTKLVDRAEFSRANFQRD